MERTPDEIKKGIKCCHINDVDLCDCESCPYAHKGWQTAGCDITMAEDALALIQQLQAQNAELLKKVEQLQVERDAALEDKRGECTYCAYFHGETIPQTCFDCANKGFYRWEWRGVQKEGEL